MLLFNRFPQEKKNKNPDLIKLGLNLEICWVSWKIPVWKNCNLSRVGLPIFIQASLIPIPTLVNWNIQNWKSRWNHKNQVWSMEISNWGVFSTRAGYLKSPRLVYAISSVGLMRSPYLVNFISSVGLIRSPYLVNVISSDVLMRSLYLANVISRMDLMEFQYLVKWMSKLAANFCYIYTCIVSIMNE